MDWFSWGKNLISENPKDGESWVITKGAGNAQPKKSERGPPTGGDEGHGGGGRVGEGQHRTREPNAVDKNHKQREKIQWGRETKRTREQGPGRSFKSSQKDDMTNRRGCVVVKKEGKGAGGGGKRTKQSGKEKKKGVCKSRRVKDGDRPWAGKKEQIPWGLCTGRTNKQQEK